MFKDNYVGLAEHCLVLWKRLNEYFSEVFLWRRWGGGTFAPLPMLSLQVPGKR